MTLLVAAGFLWAQEQVESPVQQALESSATFLQTGQPSEALDALRLVERIEPDNPWMWYYRGSAHLQTGNIYRAMECYDHALDVLLTPGYEDPLLYQTVRQHRHLARRQAFNISCQIGLAYDTNVSYVGGGSADLGLIAGQGDGKFASRWRLDYAPIADEQQTLTVGGWLGHAWHFSIEQFNYQDYGSYLRYAYKLDRRWELSLEYDYSLTYLDNEPFLSNHTLVPGLAYQWQPQPTAGLWLDKTTVFYRFEGRDFMFETTPDFDRDGLANGVGFEQTLRCRPIEQWPWIWDLSAGYRFDAISTEGTEFDRCTHNFYVGVDIPLIKPWAPDQYLLLPKRELVFSFDANWEIADYRNESLIDHQEKIRYDRLTTFSFALSQTLIQDPDYGQLILRSLINWTDTDSNISTREGAQPFTYDKVVYGCQLEWSW